MKIIFYGVRGSTPTPQADYLAWGGETTCFLVESSGGQKVIIDGGTGIRRLGEDLMKKVPGRIDILLTHFHLDHTMGLTSFAPMFTKGWDIHISACGSQREAEQKLRNLLSSPYWPVGLDDIPAKVTFHGFPEATQHSPSLVLGDLSISWAPIAHPQGCCAYRFDDGSGTSLVIATDMEWPEEKKMGIMESPLIKLMNRGEPVGLLVLDCQFDDQEYKSRQGWGHSCPAHALEIVEAGKPGKTTLTHHSPLHNDEFLDKLDRYCRSKGLQLARQNQSREVEA